MSNTIDTLSQMLGEMKSNIMHIREKTDVINDRLENVQKSTIKQGMQIDSAHERLDKFEEAHEEVKKRCILTKRLGFGLKFGLVLSLVYGLCWLE